MLGGLHTCTAYKTTDGKGNFIARAHVCFDLRSLLRPSPEIFSGVFSFLSFFFIPSILCSFIHERYNACKNRERGNFKCVHISRAIKNAYKNRTRAEVNTLRDKNYLCFRNKIAKRGMCLISYFSNVK